MRTSSYVIYVDLPDNKEQMLVVQGYTGAHDLLSRPVADYLRRLETRRAPKPLYGTWTNNLVAEDSAHFHPNEDTLERLKKRGYLTHLTIDDEEALFKKVATTLHKAHSRTPSYIVMPTYDCNLRCSYCFQDHMRTNPLYSYLLRTMTPDVVSRMIKGVWNIEGLYGLDSDNFNRNVGFFGGEPLLGKNRSVIDLIMQAYRKRGGATFWAVTNGTEIDQYKELLGPGHIEGLQITLDGPPEQHDQRRVYPDHSGSFGHIAQNIRMALDLGTNVSVRLNVDRGNVGNLPRLAEVIDAEGWTKYSNFGIYTAPIRAANDKTQKTTTFDSWELDRSMVQIQAEHKLTSMFMRPDSGIKSQARSLFDSPATSLTRLKESFCSSHTGMFIFDSFSDIYTCWERTGDLNIRAGHITENGDLELNQQTLDIWRSRTVASNPVCSKCRYALHCGGGCAILAEDKSGSLHTNFCDGFSNRFRAAVAEAYQEHVARVPVSTGNSRLCDQ